MAEYTTDIQTGQLVQTRDGMIHNVVDVQLVVWIKPIAPTDSDIIGLRPDELKRVDLVSQ